MLRASKRLDTSTQGEYTKPKPALESLKDFNGSDAQQQILPLRPLSVQTGTTSGTDTPAANGIFVQGEDGAAKRANQEDHQTLC